MYVDPRYLLSGRGRVGGEPTASHMIAAIPTAMTLRMINPTTDPVYVLSASAGRLLTMPVCQGRPHG
jgi:hypothetical protein